MLRHDDFQEKIFKEVREMAGDMDEGTLEEWLESMLSDIKELEMKCGEVNRILGERHRNFLNQIANRRTP